MDPGGLRDLTQAVQEHHPEARVALECVACVTERLEKGTVVHRCAQYVVLVASAWQEPDASAKERRIMTNRHNIALRRLYHSRFVKSR